MTRVFEAAGNFLAAVLHAANEAIRHVRASRPSGSDRDFPDMPVSAGMVDTLTFRDVVTWLTNNRPDDKRIAKAAVLREAQRNGLKVTTVFLNDKGEVVRDEHDIPLGIAQRVTRLDQELTEFFGNRDMVLFE